MIDLRFLNYKDDTGVYNPIQLKKTLHEHQINYISFTQRAKTVNDKLKITPTFERFQIIGEELVIPTINFINSLETDPHPVGLLFNYWDTKGTTKGSFSKYVHKNLPEIELNHLIMGKNNSFDIFTNHNLYVNAYGELLNIRSDMIRKTNYAEEVRYTWQPPAEDYNQMYRDAFDNNPEAEWNID